MYLERMRSWPLILCCSQNTARCRSCIKSIMALVRFVTSECSNTPLPTPPTRRVLAESRRTPTRMNRIYVLATTDMFLVLAARSIILARMFIILGARIQSTIIQRGICDLESIRSRTWFVTTQRVINGVDRIKKSLTDTTSSIRAALERSRVAQLIYYRGLAFIRATFIYDLCVSDGHVVIRGLYEFLFSIPSRCVNGVKMLWKFICLCGEVLVGIPRFLILPPLAKLYAVAAPVIADVCLDMLYTVIRLVADRTLSVFIVNAVYVSRYDNLAPSAYYAVYMRAVSIVLAYTDIALAVFLEDDVSFRSMSRFIILFIVTPVRIVLVGLFIPVLIVYNYSVRYIVLVFTGAAQLILLTCSCIFFLIVIGG